MGGAILLERPSMSEVIDKTKRQHPIRRLLRQKQSQEYFAGARWTADPDAAWTFADSVEAAQTCVHWGLSDVEMVLRVSGASSDLFCTEFFSAPRQPVEVNGTGK
jgi:hypothetical protein